jgi:glycerol-3-phosphate acyltransferase PlsX
MRIGIDAMGGDFAPAQPVKGALEAKSLLGKDDQIVLIGDEPAIRQHLDSQAGWPSFIRIAQADQVVGMNEKPVEAHRAKPRNSILRMAEMAAAGEIDACISAGNTGACVAACQMRLRRLSGVSRPGIAIVIPTLHGPVVLCDVGANVDCRPQHLYQYGVMAAEYSRGICHIADPRVGLLSIGEEDAKGNELVKETRELLRGDKSVNFVGNVEGRDIFRGLADVVVCEGFVGNVCLKLVEGFAENVFQSLFAQMGKVQGEAAGQLQAAVGKLREKFDFNEYGGAPLLGVNGVCIICHGASQHRAIFNAVRVATGFCRTGINDRIKARFADSQDARDE